MKEDALLSIRRPRDLGNKVDKYKQIDCTQVDGIDIVNFV